MERTRISDSDRQALEFRLRALAAVLWEIAGDRKPNQQEAAGVEPAADEGGLGADPRQSSFPS